VNPQIVTAERGEHRVTSASGLTIRPDADTITDMTSPERTPARRLADIIIIR
jgi:hypothetical protein